MTIFTHPTSTIALHHIFFSFVTRERAPKPPPPPSTRGPEGLCIVLCKQASPCCHVSMYGRRMCKMGLKEERGKGEEEGREKGEIHRSCRSVAGQGLGRSVFVIELETHSPTSTLQTDQTDKYKNISVLGQDGQESLPGAPADRLGLNQLTGNCSMPWPPDMST